MENHRKALLFAHGYQPGRKPEHANYQGICTSPDGINWTKRADEVCYTPLAQEGLLDQITYNTFGILKMQLEEIHPEVVAAMNNGNEEGSPLTHPILPHLTMDEKRIVIGAGVERYKRDHQTEQPPKVMWAPETALNLETLQVFNELGIEATLAKPHQVKVPGYNQTDNSLVRVQLPDNESVVVITADEPFSNALAFKDKSNAWRFTQQHVDPAFQSGWEGPLIGIADMETFGGLYVPFADQFLEYFVKTVLPDRGIELITTQDLDLSRAVDGTLVENSSWSCLCGNLHRWSEGCTCTPGDNSWKAPFYSTFENLLHDVTKLIQPIVGPDFVDTMVHKYEASLKFTGQSPESTPIDSLYAAYAAALNTRTSCATFYGDPGTSGGPTILYGHSVITHLRDAGLQAEADRIENEYRQNLRNIRIPGTNRTCEDMLEEMLNQRLVEQLTSALLAEAV